MNVPKHVKFPLSQFWFNSRTEELNGGHEPEEVAQVFWVEDGNGNQFLRIESMDKHGFGQEEIDLLNFIVEAANAAATISKG